MTFLERRKIVKNTITEIYGYTSTDKAELLAHYKKMKKRGFVNNRDNDTVKDNVTYVTYEKNIESKGKELR